MINFAFFSFCFRFFFSFICFARTILSLLGLYFYQIRSRSSSHLSGSGFDPVVCLPALILLLLFFLFTKRPQHSFSFASTAFAVAILFLIFVLRKTVAKIYENTMNIWCLLHRIGTRWNCERKNVLFIRWINYALCWLSHVSPTKL